MKVKNTEERSKTSRRLLVMALALVCVFAVLIGRLYSLQVLADDSYTAQSEKNRTRVMAVSATRGNIYDSEMNELAVSVPVFTVSLLAVPAKEREQVAERLAFYLDDASLTKEAIVETLRANARQYEAVLIKRLPYDSKGIATVSVLEEHKEEIPGLIISAESMRSYPYGSIFGHSIGYVGRISASELADNATGDYQSSDWVGKTGLEKFYETFYYQGKQIGLRGKSGVNQVVVNARDYPIETSVIEEPVQGNSLVLTMNMEVQNVMEQSLLSVIKEIQKSYPECHAGAAVLLDVKNSAVIAQASYPTMDPNDFSNGLSSGNFTYYMENPDRPLINRAISGLYAPGSTFKMVTALAALYTDVVNPNETVNCVASAWVDPRAKCTREHGRVNLYQAIAYSCNTYFQEMGYRAGIDAIYKIGSELGLGQQSGVDLPSEAAGTLPNQAYKATLFEPNNWEYLWHNYDTFYTSMGQGYNVFTVMQLANYVATIANGGTHMQPYLVQRVIDSATGETVFEHEPVVLNRLSVDEESLSMVQRGMAAVTESGGTAFSLFGKFPVKVAAKTGTAQTTVKGSDNGVFVAYAPYDDPQVAFACVIEYGQTGGGSGGIVCYNVFSQYFGLNDSDNEQFLQHNEVTTSIDDR